MQGTEFTVVNAGANGVLQSPYQPGTRWEQLTAACAAANADWYALGKQIILTAFGKPRTDQPSAILAKGTGLIGYPSFERAGLLVQCLFDPAILCGTPVDIRNSPVPGANGLWFPQAVDHLLESNMPDGRWQSLLYCLPVRSGLAA